MKAKFVFEQFRKGKDPYRKYNIGRKAQMENELEKEGVPEESYEITDELVLIPTGYAYRDTVEHIAKKMMQDEKAQLAIDLSKEKPIKEIIENAHQNGVETDAIRDILSAYGNRKQEKHGEVVLKKLERTPEKAQEEDEYNTYIFIGYNDKEPVTIQGEQYYKDEFKAEKLVKIDQYDPGELTSVDGMRMRARVQYGGEGAVYGIKVPTDFMDETDYTWEELPKYLRDLIRDNKFKV